MQCVIVWKIIWFKVLQFWFKGWHTRLFFMSSVWNADVCISIFHFNISGSIWLIWLKVLPFWLKGWQTRSPQLVYTVQHVKQSNSIQYTCLYSIQFILSNMSNSPTNQHPMSPKGESTKSDDVQQWGFCSLIIKAFFATFAHISLQQMHESRAKFSRMCTGQFWFWIFCIQFFHRSKPNRIFFETFALFALLGRAQCRGKT